MAAYDFARHGGGFDPVLAESTSLVMWLLIGLMLGELPGGYQKWIGYALVGAGCLGAVACLE